MCSEFSWAIELEIWCASSICCPISPHHQIFYRLSLLLLLLVTAWSSGRFSIDIRSENAIMMHFGVFFIDCMLDAIQWIELFFSTLTFSSRYLLFIDVLHVLVYFSCSICHLMCLRFDVDVAACCSGDWRIFLCSFFIVIMLFLFIFLSRTLLNKTIEIDFSS